jgi:2'-5' RNA ligase
VNANAFLAVDLTDDERHALAAALTAASPGAPLPGRRQAPENWHITLRFLGDLDTVTLDLVAHEVESALDAAPGTVVCRGLGAFPRASRAAVVFCEVADDAGVLTTLAAQCEEAAVDAGVAPEERPFVPHLTLSRLRPAVDVRHVFRAFGEFSVPLSVREVALMRAGAPDGQRRYETLERFALG